jgi:hypothetical protein
MKRLLFTLMVLAGSLLFALENGTYRCFLWKVKDSNDMEYKLTKKESAKTKTYFILKDRQIKDFREMYKYYRTYKGTDIFISESNNNHWIIIPTYYQEDNVFEVMVVNSGKKQIGYFICKNIKYK